MWRTIGFDDDYARAVFAKAVTMRYATTAVCRYVVFSSFDD